MKASAPKATTPKASPSQIAFRYRTKDTATGVSRATAKRLTKVLGVDETQVIHLALQDLAARVLPQYGPDEGPLTRAQLQQIKKSAPKANEGKIRSRLFGTDIA
jgi:hypothetical protein